MIEVDNQTQHVLVPAAKGDHTHSSMDQYQRAMAVAAAYCLMATAHWGPFTGLLYLPCALFKGNVLLLWSAHRYNAN